MTRYVTFASEELEANKMLGLHTEWMTAKDSEWQAELLCGAGLGNSMLAIRVTHKGERRTEVVNMQRVFRDWIDQMRGDWDPMPPIEGRYTSLTERETQPPGPPVEFVRSRPRGNKVKCSVCGREGWGPERMEGFPNEGADWSPWQRRCMTKGHRPCPDCGRMMGVNQTGQARKHRRCPGRGAT
ncbi:MAG TPA: hypothetical protein VMT27_07750 [Actinomycetes bacterium]|nr:hypothetical protein [Actinomycetes bacterium]